MQAQVQTDPTFGTEPPACGLALSNGFAAAYATLPQTPDELFEPDGSLRPHWQMFVAMLDELGPAALAQRWEQARRLIHDNGVSHNVYGDPQGLDRPWNLDSIPLLIPDAQWAPVAAALAQRARLLDLLLADIYGPATTLYQRILPPDLIWANPAFLRACSGVQPPQGRWLHLYAADLVRTPTGEFQVLSDRTQAPSGAGYCLENRIVLSRVLPTEYRQSNVHRLAPFFVALRESLASLAPANQDNPRVVLLTPGPYNETYFEHAYLARYLGYPLVHGNDLTVRDSRVYLKTLSGLQRVDVILRRVDDNFCDPVELYQSSYLGVAGLLQAVRHGTVAIANALGSGVLQAPGILPYLPALCRHLLSEDLLLPSVPTWWCGDPAAMTYVQSNLASLVIKSAFPTPSEEPIFAARLTKDELSTLAARISTRPHQFVAQQQVMETSTPAMIDQHLQPRRFVVRSYLTAPGSPAAAAENYHVMPGALTRVTGSGDSHSVSLQHGAGSKDTWILATSPVPEVTLLPTTGQPIPITRGGADLPSRIADDLFWLGRYTERFKALARLARGTLARLIDQATSPSTTATLLTRLLPNHPIDPTATGSAPVETALANTLFDPHRPSSLASHAGNIHRLARGIRDQISLDAWRTLQSISATTGGFQCTLLDATQSADSRPTAVLATLDDLIEHGAAFAGLVNESMTRGQSWLFLDLGRRIERASATSQLLLNCLVPSQDDPVLLETILEITDSSIAYRRRYLAHLETHAVVDLLLTDTTNPRSVIFQLEELQRHLIALPHAQTSHQDASHPRIPELTTASDLTRALQSCDVSALCLPSSHHRPALDTLLRQTMDQLASLTTAITRLYFAHSMFQHNLPQHLPQNLAPHTTAPPEPAP